MDYIVRDPVTVNGVRRQRGDELTGEDAEAVEASALIRARCIPHRYNEQMKAAAPTKAPSSSTAAKNVAADKGE